MDMSKRKYRIILIDDYRNGLETFADLLRCWGYVVTPVSSGIEALRLLDNGAYDLVITNVTDVPRKEVLHKGKNTVKPDMTNIEVVKAVRRKRPALPVIVFAPYGSADSAAKAMRQGAADHIRRPFSVEELKSRLETVLNMPDFFVEGLMLHTPKSML